MRASSGFRSCADLLCSNLPWSNRLPCRSARTVRRSYDGLEPRQVRRGTGAASARSRKRGVQRELLAVRLRSLTLALAAAVTLAGAAVAGKPPHVIQGDHSFGGVKLGRTTAPEAAGIFRGEGKRVVRRRPNSCLVSWPRIGLTVDFGTIGSDPANPCVRGAAFVATVTSRSAWRTAVGLRVGDGVPRLQRLYPRATLHRGSLGSDAGRWLITRRLCPTVGGAPYPALLARTQRGRVAALVARVGICD